MRFPSKTECRILEVLAVESELTGLAILEAAQGRLARGGLYVLLGRLREKGLVQTRLVPAPKGLGGKPRRLYRLSALGTRIVEFMASAGDLARQ